MTSNVNEGRTVGYGQGAESHVGDCIVERCVTSFAIDLAVRR
jgi:hypothetical protein